MPLILKSKQNQFLENIANELDIPPSKYEQAKERYLSVGKWLEEDGLPKAQIFIQGSFRLGTVVRPIKEGKESDYDIDQVCQYSIKKIDTPPKLVKDLTGDRLKANGRYSNILAPEGSRCWTLQYAEEDGIGFHIDILPAIPEDLKVKNQLQNQGVPFPLADKAIAITEKSLTNYSWKSSNPQGYADWFDEIKKPAFEKLYSFQKENIVKAHRTIYSKIEDVPDIYVKTPLQGAIQIFKRYRDLRFQGHEWESEKPISIIITTLAAKLYQQEEDIFSTITNIVERLDKHSSILSGGIMDDRSLQSQKIIEWLPNNGQWKIPNPVNEDENFADRWHENNHLKAKAFFKWVSWLKNDFLCLLNSGNLEKTGKELIPVLGERVVLKALGKVVPSATLISPGLQRDDVPHIKIVNPAKPYGE